jgi:hypothetical protein
MTAILGTITSTLQDFAGVIANVIFWGVLTVGTWLGGAAIWQLFERARTARRRHVKEPRTYGDEGGYPCPAPEIGSGLLAGGEEQYRQDEWKTGN